MLPMKPGETAGVQAAAAMLEKLAGDATSAIWKNATESIDYLAEKLKFHFLGIFSIPESSRWDMMLDPFRQAGLLTADDAARIKSLKDYGHPFDWVFFFTTFFKLLGEMMSAPMNAGVARMQQAVNKQQRPSLPDPRELIQAAFIAPEKTGEIRDIMARMGYRDSDMDLFFLANYTPTDVQTIMILWLRKEIDDNRMYERMRELGYTDTRIAEIVKTWEIIPGPQDLLTMVAHEAFEPDSIAKMGLDEEFPAAQSEWLAKQGLSEFWQKKYWAAHWEQPSIQAGYEMLHRGIIDQATLEFLYRTVEIPRYWRDKLTAIAYQPYTRVDVRRMHKMGVLDDAELLKAYTDVGYDKEHAQKMADFTVRYNQGAEKELTKGEILTGYSDKLISQSDTMDLLIAIGYSSAQSEYYIELEDFKETQATQKLLLDDVGARYKAALIDYAEASRLLDSLNLPAAQKSSLLDKWTISRPVNVKLPSKSDLDKFFVLGVISEDSYRLEMERLGYGTTYVSWYLAVARAAKAKKQQITIPL